MMKDSLEKILVIVLKYHLFTLLLGVETDQITVVYKMNRQL